jgi:hypothetical protein
VVMGESWLIIMLLVINGTDQQCGPSAAKET